ncbi:NAD(P)-dependent alcohol dehydrogenase [Nocardioides sp. Kera G14]|uniref:NAD(P)-dependent alcohol dehydrogenase n=1 Tax=Nocardioides sp. Kera G14 TaxID=2884264 RepID=UPI001D11358F|nr:NAD(P)-dependent alcohol dehydrogenase [Nocardioides sp. Kera G14]UDY22210.1 NAD(P)-dependent alcohol dehydrogenase [Nocardioides sp. Kera G14]
MRTRAAVVDSPGADFTLQQIELDEPRADEVLVRMVATGICHTDITLKGFLPAEMFPNVFGHEGAGIVEAVGEEVTGIRPGDHVVLSFRSCRTCAKCRSGEVGLCESTLMLNYMGMRMDGSTTFSRDGSPVFGSFFGQSSLSQYSYAYADNCVVVDPAADLTRLAPYGCGFQTGAGTVFNVLKPTAEDSIAVFGAGAVGLAALAAAQTAGAGTIIAVDPNPARLELASRYGAVGIDPTAEDPVARIKELTGGSGSTYTIDTTAIPDVVLQAQRALAGGGTLVVLGLGAETYTIDAVDLLQGGKKVMASIEGDSDPLQMVPHLISLTEQGQFEVQHLIATYPVERINDAVADALAGKVVKPVLVW